MQFAEPRQRVCHLERERNHRREFPNRQPTRSTRRPPYHNHAATAVDGTAANSARCSACIRVAIRRALAASSSNASCVRAPRDPPTRERSHRPRPGQSLRRDGRRALLRRRRASVRARARSAPRVPKSATPGGPSRAPPRKSPTRCETETRAPCAALGDGFDTAGERSRHDVGHVRHLGTQTLARLAARAAFHPGGVFGDERGEETSAEIRLHRRSSVSRRAARKYFAAASRRGACGELEERAERNARGAGGACATRGFDEIVEAGHVSHRGHLEEGRQDRDEDGEEERPPVLAREHEHGLGAREGVVRDGRVGERERVGVGVGGEGGLSAEDAAWSGSSGSSSLPSSS